jgi:hypothetical protein
VTFTVNANANSLATERKRAGEGMSRRELTLTRIWSKVLVMAQTPEECMATRVSRGLGDLWAAMLLALHFCPFWEETT